MGRADPIQKPSWEPNGGRGRQFNPRHLGPNGSSKSSPSRDHLGEGAEIKGHTVSSCGASPGQSKWETAGTMLVLGELGRVAMIEATTLCQALSSGPHNTPGVS